MNIFNIAWKLIFTKKKFSYTSISLCISVLVSAISVATAISILGISRNYESSIKSSVSSIEPQITVTHLYNETVSASTIDSLKKILYSNYVGYLTYESIACEYLESYAMLKNKNKSIGVLVYGIPQNCLYSIYDFIEPLSSNPKLNLHKNKNSSEFLYLSESIYNNIGTNDSDEIYLFNLPEIVRSNSLKALKTQVTSVYNSKVKMFDEKVVFTSMGQFRELFNIDSNLYSGLMIDNFKYVDSFKIKEIENRFNVTFINWEEKYYNLLEWLTIFSNPIKLIMIFILILSSAYFVFTLLLLLYDKSNMILRMKALGFSDVIINKIVLTASMILFIVSVFTGVLFSILIEYLINIFGLIRLDQNIYLIDSLKSSINSFDILMICLIYFSITILPIVILSTVKSYKMLRSK